MDMTKAIQELSATYSLRLTENDDADMLKYISTVLELHANGDLARDQATDYLMRVYKLINTGDQKTLRNVIYRHGELSNGGNWPSMTGNSSGSGRGNAPEKV